MAYTPGTSVSFTIDGKEVYGSEALELLKDSLATYEFGQKQVQWRFCNRCGSNILGVKEGVWGFNVSFLSFFLRPGWMGVGLGWERWEWG